MITRNQQPIRTEIQLKKLGYIYDAIARLLPTEGRDFKTEVMFSETGTPRIKVMGITPMGKLWARHCMAQLQQALRKVIDEDTPGKSQQRGRPDASRRPTTSTSAEDSAGRTADTEGATETADTAKAGSGVGAESGAQHVL